MSDERLQAGRHHLINGRRALQLGFRTEGRSYFEAALLQFRGPELRLGTAHALRGLAEIALAEGALDEAEARAREALDEYAALITHLDAIDEVDAVRAIRDEARQGEAAGWTVLAEQLALAGRAEEAQAALRGAHGRLGEGDEGEGLPAAAVWSGLGRLALREGRHPDAIEAFERAEAIHRRADDPEGRVITLLAQGEARQRHGDPDGAGASLQQALVLAREIEHLALEARVLCALGAAALRRGRGDEARSYYEDALPRARSAGDVEREALALVGLGDAASLAGDPAALEALREGIRLLVNLDRREPLAVALHRLGMHARRIERHGLALAAAEASRRLALQVDPVHRHGQALRIVVKALAALGQGRGALVAALLRVRVAGAVQPNAEAVAAWFRERAPAEALAELDALDEAALLDEATDCIAAVLDPVLAELGCGASDLGDPACARRVVEALSRGLDQASPSAVAVSLDAPTETGEDGPEVPASTEAPTPRREAGEGAGYVGLDELYGGLYGGDEEG